jgi:hypothetical protein
MKGIDHLVLAGRNLDDMCARYGELGFTLTPRARHPFGTGNSLIQLDGCFLELLSIVEPGDIVEARPGHFSFGAFNRDFLSKHEGMAMLALDSHNAREDCAQFRASGIDSYEPFDFSRSAVLPGGEKATVEFSLAFATNSQMPWAGFFTCEQHAPEHFWRKEYQSHANTARSIEEVCLVASEPRKLFPFLTALIGTAPVKNSFQTNRGFLRVLRPGEFEMRYGMKAPSTAEGARFAGFTVGVEDPAYINRLTLKRVGIRLVGDLFGTAVAFAKTKRQ